MKKIVFLQTGALALSLLATGVMAAISPEEVAKLGTSLTPLGGEKTGNADGSIPAWTGGLKPGAAPVDGNGFLGNPYASDKPLFVITPANVDQYKDKLTPGQLAMFKRYPDTYKIPVYPTRRSASSPESVYEAAKKSAASAELVSGGDGIANVSGRYYPFPIPKSGVEVVWNHETRYRGTNYTQQIAQATPQVNGDYTIVSLQQNVGVPSLMKDFDPKKVGDYLFLLRQEVTAPSRMAGNVLLVYETTDQVKEPRSAWSYNAGQRRVRRAPQVAYDGPGTAADGLRTADNADMYNGSPDRYQWKLIGKREMYVPYNNYKLWSPQVKYADILKPGHINQDLTRYELHRVWEVEGTLKPGQRHIYAKRHMYFDEDTWSLLEVDHYDGRGQLWRVGEGYQVNDYQHGISLYAAQALYDLIAGRYLVFGMTNESKKATQYDQNYSMNDFTPAALRNAGIR
ncbi:MULTISPECIES: DUF1329 domain-containing protein [Pseudomonas]|uniref:DUF1329 domain-containing protein n=2 Tax=Pseudomonas nitroreducens TaxID=46680 RepID=A0A6G6IX02_PSENT|nr:MULTISPECIES: DUF1329 domain-containing protein [Pseudomonas]MBG6289890.1 DUF1329 domain-containing protein [Pseudomonas nitroreducens]NMZ58965.1 DUF1329 domain-containing protein [Pseudomonas nitroreducens]NMZ73658.1 DUF1329 domain-containing protein [Pseudomonas nitroreducens]OBY49291.1 outer membrane lipoprotein-sorting protein [Pseudomonas sp. AU12215]QIE87524.1 DUF1329 domain-containing protein [Pseudomonas nitroreducens]